METIRKAILYFGSQAKMSEEISVRSDQIHKWLNQILFPSVKAAIKIEEKTNGELTAEEILLEAAEIKMLRYKERIADTIKLEKDLSLKKRKKGRDV